MADYKPLTDERSFPPSSLQPQPQPPQPHPQMIAPQQPSYTVLPNGQVQMTVTLPMGAAPPPQYPYPYPYPFQPQAQFQHPQFMQPYVVPPTYPMQPPSSLYYVAPVIPTDNLAVANLVTFIVGMFTFIPHIISLIYSFIMVHKGYFQGGKKATIIILSVIELLGWLGCASLSWLVTTDCYSYGSAYYRDYYCYDEWWGWITIVIWFGLGIACGIPRVVFTWQAAKQRQTALATPFNPVYPNSSL